MLSLFEILIKWNIKIYHTVYIIVWLFLALFAGTRVCTGGDWIDYGNMFRTESQGTFELVSDSGHELLFRLLAYLSFNLGFEFEHFLLIIALATSYLVAKSFYMINPKRMFLLTLLYYSVAMFNQQFLLIRSGLAAALYIYGISYLVRDNRTNFVLSGILAYFTHASSIVPFVLAYWLKLQLSRKFIVPILALAILGKFFSNYLFAGLEFLVGLSGSSYSNYLDAGGRYTREGQVINTALLVLLFIFVYLFIRFGNPFRLVTKRKIIDHQDITLHAVGSVIESNNISPIFINLAILFAAVNISLPFPGIVPRLNLYLLMPVWVFMIYVTTVADRHVSWILNVLIVVYSLIAILTLVLSPDLFIFQKYESWLLDPSLNFDACSTEGQY